MNILRVLLLVLLAIASQSADAAEYSSNCGINSICDQGVAYSDGGKIIASIYAERDICQTNACGRTAYMITCGLVSGAYGFTIPAITGPFTNGTNSGWRDYRVLCPSNTTYRITSYAQASTCSARGTEKNQFVTGMTASGNQCVDGCEAVTRGGITVNLNDGSGNAGHVTLDFAVPAKICAATPGLVATSNNPTADNCIQQTGGLTQCYNPATKQACAVASTGKRFCWSPGETGPKVAADVTQAASRADVPYTPTPPPPPSTTTEWSTTQSGTATNTNTTNGVTSSTTYTTNVYNNVPAGTGNGTGTQNGGTINPGTGTADQCTGVGSDCTGAGNATTGVVESDLYTDDTKTVASVVGTYKTAVLATPIAQATAGFFNVTASGSCPALEVEASEFWDAMSFEHHCSGPLHDALELAGLLMLAVAAYGAFKIAMG